MELDLTNVETDVEALIDAALLAVPGNPIVLAPVERGIIHAVLTGIVHLIDSKLAANAPASVYPTVSRPAETAAKPSWLATFGAKLEGIFAPVKAAQAAGSAQPAAVVAKPAAAPAEAAAAQPAAVHVDP